MLLLHLEPTRAGTLSRSGVQQHGFDRRIRRSEQTVGFQAVVNIPCRVLVFANVYIEIEA